MKNINLEKIDKFSEQKFENAEEIVKILQNPPLAETYEGKNGEKLKACVWIGYAERDLFWEAAQKFCEIKYKDTTGGLFFMDNYKFKGEENYADYSFMNTEDLFFWAKDKKPEDGYVLSRLKSNNAIFLKPYF